MWPHGLVTGNIRERNTNRLLQQPPLPYSQTRPQKDQGGSKNRLFFRIHDYCVGLGRLASPILPRRYVAILILNVSSASCAPPDRVSSRSSINSNSSAVSRP